MRILFWTIIALFPISEVLLNLNTRAHGAKGDRVEDNRTGRHIWRAIGIAVLLAMFSSRLTTFRMGFHFTGLVVTVAVLMALGILIRWSAILTLGRYFTVNVASVRITNWSHMASIASSATPPTAVPCSSSSPWRSPSTTGSALSRFWCR